jgi:hypothetical protein
MKRIVVALLFVALAFIPGRRSPAQEKARPIAAALGAIQNAAAEEAIVKQVEQQYAGQFRQMYKSELHFMRVVTEPTRQQFEKIAADAEPGNKAAMRSFAMSMRGMARDQGDPRSIVAAAIAKAVKETLSPEQAARFQKEIDLRTAAHKRLFVTNLVAMIDQVVILQPEQRDRLAKVLIENWDDSWQMQILMYGGQYFPAMPDAKIVPILSDAQRQVWQGVSRNTVRFGANFFGFAQGAELDDEVWPDDPTKNPAGGKP